MNQSIFADRLEQFGDVELMLLLDRGSRGLVQGREGFSDLAVRGAEPGRAETRVGRGLRLISAVSVAQDRVKLDRELYLHHVIGVPDFESEDLLRST